jgi:signal transduction histidine kinase
MRRFGIGMRWWLAATFALIAAVTAVAVTIISSDRTERALHSRARDFAVGNAISAADAIGQGIERGNLRETIDGIESRRRLAVFVFNARGEPLSPKVSRNIKFDAIKQRFEAVADALQSKRFIRSVDNGNATLVAVPIPGKRGAVLAFASRPELAAQLGVVRREVVEAAFIGAAIGSLAGLLVAVLIAGRLRRILAAAESIEGGDFEARLRPRFRDELGQLAATINRMRERLRVSFAKVESERDALQRLLERLHEGVIAVDRRLRVRFANDAARRILGVPDLSEGHRLPEPWSNVSLRNLVAPLFTGPAEQRQEVVFPDALRTYSLVGIPASPDSDTAVVVITDISEREQRERAEREFVTNAAHELRTPLTTISGAVQVLQAGAKDSADERDRFLAHIERESARLGRLTRALLVLARAQTGEEIPMVDAVELRPLLDEIAAEYGPRSAAEVEVRCPPDLAALADRDLIEQALSNLAANAVEHTEHGKIVLSAQRMSSGAVVIEVEDTGRGIAAAEQERVFDRFYRGQRRDGRGFGLGLAIVSEAVRALHGQIELDSKPGAGTTVRLTLPGTRERAA